MDEMCGAFNEAPLMRKLFGYGQETVRMLTVSNFHDEMLEITERVYDNAHNELLQYLLTIGFLELFHMWEWWQRHLFIF